MCLSGPSSLQHHHAVLVVIKPTFTAHVSVTDVQAPADFVVPDHLRPVAVRSATPASSSSTAATAQAAAVKQQSLIDRYNLSSRLAGDSAKASASPEPPTSGGGSGVSSGVATPSSIASGKWEATREDREKDLRARKERMILEARRKILEKEAKEAAAAADKAKAE
jgi:coupling of ubiquitin conjugation to ER degradation protein 1